MLSKHRNLDLILSANICHNLREGSAAVWEMRVVMVILSNS